MKKTAKNNLVVAKHFYYGKDIERSNFFLIKALLCQEHPDIWEQALFNLYEQQNDFLFMKILPVVFKELKEKVVFMIMTAGHFFKKKDIKTALRIYYYLALKAENEEEEFLIRYNIALCFLALKEFDKARGQSLKLKELNPKSEKLKTFDFLLLKAKGNTAKALSFYKKVNVNRQNTVEYLENTAILYYEQKNYFLSARSLKNVLKIKSNSYAALKYLGLCYQKMKLFDKANGAFLKYLKLKPADDAVLREVGWYYIAKKDEIRKGIDYIKTALRHNPFNLLAKIDLGIAFLKLRQYRNAAETWEYALNEVNDYRHKDNKFFNSLNKIYSLLNKLT